MCWDSAGLGVLLHLTGRLILTESFLPWGSRYMLGDWFTPSKSITAQPPSPWVA